MCTWEMLFLHEMFCTFCIKPSNYQNKCDRDYTQFQGNQNNFYKGIVGVNIELFFTGLFKLETVI